MAAEPGPPSLAFDEAVAQCTGGRGSRARGERP
jgi:hypothetical protein